MSSLGNERTLFQADEFMKRLKENRNLNPLFSKNSESTFQRNNLKKVTTFSITDNNFKLDQFLHNIPLIDGIYDGSKINIIKQPEKIYPYTANNNHLFTSRFAKNKRTRSSEQKNGYRTLFNKNEKKI